MKRRIDYRPRDVVARYIQPWWIYGVLDRRRGVSLKGGGEPKRWLGQNDKKSLADNVSVIT